MSDKISSRSKNKLDQLLQKIDIYYTRYKRKNPKQIKIINITKKS